MACDCKGKSESKVSGFYLECKQVTGSSTWVKCRQICIMVLGIVSMSVEALMRAVDQTVKDLVSE
jgi:hypothetical protein